MQLVPQSNDWNIIGSKWVLWIKKKLGGVIDKYKTWLVAQEFTQVEGVDYFVMFAPIAKLAALCIILFIAAQNDWEINVFNFHSAFLNGEFDNKKEIYME